MATRLVGRASELARLADEIGALSVGRGGLVAVTGEAGVGKSRLVAEAAAAATGSGVTVLTGRSVEGTGAALRPVAEALLAAFRDRPPPTDPGLTPFRSALGHLVPEWATSDAPPAEPLVRNEGILRLLRAIGGARGTVIVLEDLHWAEPETLGVVEHIATHAVSQPVLCIATVRSEPPSAGSSLVRSLSNAGLAQVVGLHRLSDAEVVELARLTAPTGLDAESERIVCERAEGLPLFAEDLVVTARTTGVPLTDVVPLTFADTVYRRIAALGPEGAQVLRAAAVLGRRFDWRLLPTVAGVDEHALGPILRASVDAQLLVATPQSFAFRHALTADAVLAELLPIERTQLAAQALRAVEEAHPGLPGEWCELAAGLADAADDAKRCAALLSRAARDAIASGALLAAEAMLDRALGVLGAGSERGTVDCDPPELDPLVLDLEQLQLEVLSLAGKTDQALQLGASLLERQPASEHGTTHLRLARAAAAAHRGDIARDHIRKTIAAAEAGSDLLARADALAATIAMTDGRVDEAVELAERAVSEGTAAGAPDAVCEALEVLGRAARLVDLDQAERWFARAAETAKGAGMRLREISALHELGTVDMLRSSNLARLEAARTAATDAGALAIAAVVDLQLAGSYALRFEPEAALRTVERGAAIAGLFDLGLTLPMLLVQGASAYATLGRAAEMEAAIERAAVLSHDHPDVWAVAWGHGRALLAFFREDRAATTAALWEALEWSKRPECGIPGVFSGLLALVTAVDDPKDSAATLRDELRASHSMVISLNRALLGYADAVAAARAGRSGEATSLVAEMDALFETKEASEGWRHLGRRLLAEAAVADGWGEPVVWIREALPWFEQRGHVPVVAACKRLLVQAGAPVPRRGRGDSAVPPELASLAVTSREVDVLGLVGQGLSNAEIAARLFLSPRTVEKHVERLKDKTSTETREGLSRIAVNYGVVAP